MKKRLGDWLSGGGGRFQIAIFIASLILFSSVSSQAAFNCGISLSPHPEFNHQPTQYLGGGITTAAPWSEGVGQHLEGAGDILATLAVYERRARQLGQPLELSPEYLIFHSLMADALPLIKIGQPKFSTQFVPVRDEFYFGHLDEVIAEHGLLPKTAWNPLRRFGADPAADRRMFFGLNVLIAGWRSEIARHPFEDNEIRAAQEIRSFLESEFGIPPTSFAFLDRSLSPQSFAKLPLFASPENLGRGWSDTEWVDLDVESHPREAFGAIQKQLGVTGEPVRLFLEWTDTFLDAESGVISYAAFTSLVATDESWRWITKKSGKNAIFRSVLVQDIDVDAQGNPVKLLLLDFGAPGGKVKHWHLYWDYFKVNALRIRVMQSATRPG